MLNEQFILDDKLTSIVVSKYQDSIIQSKRSNFCLSESIFLMSCRTVAIFSFFAVCSSLRKKVPVSSIMVDEANEDCSHKEQIMFGLATPSTSYKFFCRESLVYLKQCLVKETRFDLIVCEAPSFLRGEKGVFKIENDLETLLKSCLQSLNPEGKLLFSTTSEKLFIEDIRKTVSKIQKTWRNIC